MGVAVITIGSFEKLVITIVHFRAVAGFYLCDSVVRLHHTLFGPMYARRSFTEHVLSFSIEVPYPSECADVVETYFMLYGVGVAHDVAKEFHALLREAL